MGTGRFVRAYESADLDAVVALLTDDVFVSMPPVGSVACHPGIASSLSSVPPVWPSPRPESWGTAAPHAATSGASGSGALRIRGPRHRGPTVRQHLRFGPAVRPRADASQRPARFRGLPTRCYRHPPRDRPHRARRQRRPDLRHDPLRQERAAMVRASAIAPEPIAGHELRIPPQRTYVFWRRRHDPDPSSVDTAHGINIASASAPAPADRYRSPGPPRLVLLQRESRLVPPGNPRFGGRLFPAVERVRSV
jgi:hypothetical protein